MHSENLMLDFFYGSEKNPQFRTKNMTLENTLFFSLKMLRETAHYTCFVVYRGILTEYHDMYESF